MSTAAWRPNLLRALKTPDEDLSPTHPSCKIRHSSKMGGSPASLVCRMWRGTLDLQTCLGLGAVPRGSRTSHIPTLPCCVTKVGGIQLAWPDAGVEAPNHAQAALAEGQWSASVGISRVSNGHNVWLLWASRKPGSWA